MFMTYTELLCNQASLIVDTMSRIQSIEFKIKMFGIIIVIHISSKSAKSKPSNPKHISCSTKEEIPSRSRRKNNKPSDVYIIVIVVSILREDYYIRSKSFAQKII